eukprot:scaffold11266_cov162-Isochrysis_galbana.AAC.3
MLVVLSLAFGLRTPLIPLRTTSVAMIGTLTDAPVAVSRKNWISHWMDYLKFGDAEPTFDVLERTMEYAAVKTSEEAVPYYAADYIFRGSIIGPITNQDVIDTQAGFDITGAYPDLDRGVFGFTIDPNNPFRCFFFERWTGTHTGTISIGPLIKLPATRKRVETPLHITSITWNPDGKIVYQSISPPVDRFEGNTKGAGAVFGLLNGAGLDNGPASVGLPTLMLQQKLVQASGLLGKQWSSEDRIPRWWKSASRGADPNDM